MIKNIDSSGSFDSSRSVIEDFASFFHQDFSHMEETPDEHAQKIFNSLSEQQKTALRKSMIKLIEEHPGKKQKGLLKAWYKLGATWWDKKIDLSDTIKKWIVSLN